MPRFLISIPKAVAPFTVSWLASAAYEDRKYFANTVEKKRLAYLSNISCNLFMTMYTFLWQIELPPNAGASSKPLRPALPGHVVARTHLTSRPTGQ